MDARAIACALLLVGLAGCAATARGPAPASVALPAGGPRGGTILSLRPVSAASTQVASIGTAIGAPVRPAADIGGSTEYIVQTDDGSVISVVQAGAAELHPGDRVTVLRDNAIRLVRAGS
jgi:outer membrane lipoprotein SlyB